VSEEALLVFVSYSRVDLDWLNKFNKQLASLVRTQKIKTWHDRDIEAGNEWEPEIQRRLSTADIIILLISADFMASDYCYGNELTRAITRHDAGEAVVIPVILRPCVWNLPKVPFSKLNVLPDHARPITRWEDPDEALAAVALHISNRVDALRKRKVEQAEEQQWEKSEKLRQAEVQERQRKYQENLQRYEQEFTRAITAQYPIDSFVRDGLTKFQESLELSDEDVARIEAPLVAPKKAAYEQRLADEQRRKEEAARQLELERQRKLEQQRQEQLKQEAAEKQRQAAEQERQREAAEQLRQQQAAEAARLQQQELERRQQEQQKQEAASKKRQEALKGNYAQLEVLLKAGKWKEADQETAKRMFEVMGRQKEGWLRVEDIQQFPCADLCKIDQLWVKYSNGKFGFSVQKKIWERCGSPQEYNKAWFKFGGEVGWRSKGLLGIGSEWKSYNELTFDTSAPFGHLPGGVVGFGGSWGERNVFSRAKDCRL
jgi:hypothetical protein